jgi:glycerol-3-phosphate dehydrogenase subunit C
MNLHQLPIEISLDQCIKCNICTTVCPVSAVTDLFPGPKYEAPQAGRFRHPGDSSPDISVDYCSGCRACNMACPTGVKIAEMNARARSNIVQQGKIPLQLRLRNNLIARAELMGKMALPVAPLANAVLTYKPARIAIEKVLGISHRAPLPSFSTQRFTTWFKLHKRAENIQRSRKVVYFHGCSTQYYEPRVGKAAVQILEKNGFEVIVPRQNCCGLPLLSNGEFRAAHRYHESNIKSLSNFARLGIPIVGTSTSCTLTLKEEAPDLLDMHDEDTDLVAKNTFDFNEFILMLHEEQKLNLDLQPIPLSLPYHIPCQYRAHRLGRPGVEVLDLIPQLRISESKATCCGIAGTYGYKKEKYTIGMDVGKKLFEFIHQSNAPVVICDSETCRWQITHATSMPAVHPAEILAAAYGFTPEGPLATIIPK